MAAVAERELLLLMLESTRGEPAARSTLRSTVRVTNERLDNFINRLSVAGLISSNGGLFEASQEQRLKIAVRAVKLGSDIERVGRALGWLEFEELTAHIFEENGYSVHRRFRFTAEGRRWEIDVLARRNPLVVCVECKRWVKGLSNAAANRTASHHLEKTRVFSVNILKLCKKLGMKEWGSAVVLPITMSLTPAPSKFYSKVPVVPILKLPSFLNDLAGHLDYLAHYKVEIPPKEPSKPLNNVKKKAGI